MAEKRLKRPRDPISLAKLVGDIAIGEVQDSKESSLTKRARAGGLRGGAARANILPPEQRSEIARVAAAARWKKRD